MVAMSAGYYLLKFRKCRSLDSVDLLCDKFDQELTGLGLIEMHRAADHRRAELELDQIFDEGHVLKSAWGYVK
ncbi:MAG: Hha/YmoA family nucleoid-associated regulatory protein [Candidatus Symbiodolus clandestinus]